MFSDKTALALIAAAKTNGIEPAAMLAIVEVETGGKMFEDDGRTPQFLYERHVAYREAAKRSTSLRAKFEDGVRAPRAGGSFATFCRRAPALRAEELMA